MPDRYGDPEPDEPDAIEPVPDDLWAAEDRARAVTACQMCDDDGYRGMRVCDHQDHSGAAARGMAKAREVLDAIKARRGAL